MPRPTGLAADIRWTAYGVPHIRAKDERGLGYGIGYAYARDNACLLAEEIVTARGERARYFGSEGKSSAELDNLPSDIFYAWLNQPEALQAFWQAQTPAVRQLLEGYAAGFNRFLREADGKTTSCLGQPWLRAIATDDLLRLTRRLLVEGGVGQFADALVAAAPPGTEKVALSGEQAFQVAEQRRQRFRLERGSNAIAVGSERSADGKGMLLANPHFPWNGAMRFYQMHLTIPGRLDVMGPRCPACRWSTSASAATWPGPTRWIPPATSPCIAWRWTRRTRGATWSTVVRCRWRRSPSRSRCAAPTASCRASSTRSTSRSTARWWSGPASWTGTAARPMRCVTPT